MRQDASSAAQNPEPPVQANGAKKPVKNLYEPYSTPRVLYDLMRFLALSVFFIFMRVHLIGRHHLPRKGPYIIASNHLAWTDVPMVAAYVPGKVVYMAKYELFQGPVGWLVRFLGAFPVKREEGDRQALRAADEQLKKGNVLVIFPEGTRSKSRELAKGHAGLGMIALRAQVPVIPVAIWGSEDSFKKFAAPITVHYGEPIILKPKGAKITREDIDGATTEVMQRIAAMLPARYRGVYAEQ